MFSVTRTAAAMTKLERKIVKLVAKEKINPENASDIFQSLNNKATEKAKYSKNIFKRAYVWIKTFVGNFKQLNKDLKDNIKKTKEEWNESLAGKFTKKDIKEIKDSTIGFCKTFIQMLNEECKTLMKKAPVKK